MGKKPDQEMWRQFEARVKRDLTAYNVAITHIPSHIERTKRGTFRKKTDCDFAAGLEGRALFFDAKVCAEPQFNVQSLILRDKKVHQYNFLLSAHERGSIGGYLIWFYNQRKIVWLPVENVKAFETSIKPEDDQNLISTEADDVVINMKRLTRLGGK